MSEIKQIYECQDCGHRAEWVMMHLRSHGGRDCLKCGGEVDKKEPTAREILLFRPMEASFKDCQVRHNEK